MMRRTHVGERGQKLVELELGMAASSPTPFGSAWGYQFTPDEDGLVWLVAGARVLDS